MNKGDRVGAIYKCDQKENKYEIFGYGVYQGEEVPLEAVGFMADMVRENKIGNPKIFLDNGEILYGCECWWGSESQVKSKIESAKKAGYKIVTVSINKIREEFKTDEAN